MIVYVSHSREFDYQKELYDLLDNLKLEIEFILPHKYSDTPFNSKDFLQNKKCDLVLAEVSYPSTGQGIELGWADIFQIPILAIYKKDFKISGSLKVICKDFIEYESPEDLLLKLRKIFNSKL
jgi:hypothetical protein